MRKPLLLAAIFGLGLTVPAYASLQIAFTDGVTTFTCADGQLGCDFAGAAKNLLTLNTTIGNFFVSGTLSVSSSGLVNNLNLSSFSVTNNGSTEGDLSMVVSDTGFTAPVGSIEESASLTFNNNVGAGDSLLKFWADNLDQQGAGNPIQTPGTLLDTVSGAAATNPDSFSGTKLSSFISGLPFSMTEGATLDLIAGGSVVGFNQDMQSSAAAVPVPGAALLFGSGLVGLVSLARRQRNRRQSV